ncbi:MAG TPA: rhodanese-like domain-containing protein, partial [Planctomycetota bacterium]|nr:rhodanese-like domain-containing protein [Planctomycetota bacterium]
EETQTAVVVDPRRDVDLYLEEAAKLGLTIRHVILTHFHADFLAGHLADSVNVGLGGRFASWVGSVLASDRGIVILVEPGREEEAAVRLGRIGFDRVVGFLKGGFGALDGHTEFVRSARRVAAAELADMLAAEDAPLVIDIRAPGEWQAGHVEGARHVPLNELEARVEEFPRDRPFVLQCGSGYRSTIAASLLERHGYDDLCDQNGGFGAWAEGMLPVVIPAVTESDG